MKMINKRLFVVLLLSMAFMAVPFVHASTITSCTFNKDTYNQGEAGYIEVTIFNDADEKIRVTEFTATINYYYIDGNEYYQKFFTEATLPTEIPQGESKTFNIPFSLPTIIAPGYVNVQVRATTEEWRPLLEIWFGSEHPTYQPLLYIESPYKEQLDEKTAINDQLERQLDEQSSINQSTTNIMYMLGATTVVFAAVTVLLFVTNRTRAVSVPMHAHVGRKGVDESKKAAKESVQAGKNSVKKA
jgi:hypothetical protein